MKALDFYRMRKHLEDVSPACYEDARAELDEAAEFIHRAQLLIEAVHKKAEYNNPITLEELERLMLWHGVSW